MVALSEYMRHYSPRYFLSPLKSSQQYESLVDRIPSSRKIEKDPYRNIAFYDQGIVLQVNTNFVRSIYFYVHRFQKMKSFVCDIFHFL